MNQRRVNKKRTRLLGIDDKDIKIISSLLSGRENGQMAKELRIPLSTVQRRTRLIMQSGLLQHFFRPDYRRLGLKKGMIHVYLNDGEIKNAAEEISALDGVTNVAIHIGNSDIVADFVYQESEQIVDIVSAIKKVKGVEKTVWSEEVYVIPIKPQKLAAPFQRLIAG